MARKSMDVAACVGAVVGAGFASGREVIAFFTRFGAWAGWLVLLAAGTMALLCELVMRTARARDAQGWRALYGGLPGWMGRLAQSCAWMLLAVTGGAMVAAAGHLTRLLWASEWAYSVGVVGTLLAARFVARANLDMLGWISGALTVGFVGVMLAASRLGPGQSAALPVHAADGAWAAVRAVAYAAMNMTLAIGVVCRCAQDSRKSHTAAWFGLALAGLLLLANGLYAAHPELLCEPLPIVRLMAAFGRGGFIASAALMYLAVFTSLVAVLCALDESARTRGPWLRAAAAIGPPLAMSMVGFEGIVDGLYAPAGLACLLTVFGPLAYGHFAHKSP